MSNYDSAAPAQQDQNKLIAQRRQKLAQWRASDQAFPNDFRRDSLAAELHRQFGDQTIQELEAAAVSVKVAGRMIGKRVMGKASFAHVQDMSGRIQLFLRRDDLPCECYQQFKGWDVGDIVGAEGQVFKTQAGELSIRVFKIRLLTKSLRPLPEKYHGLADQEARYRQRYLDLIVNESSRRTFILRSRIIQWIRAAFNARGFLEVETPMMQPIPGGAAARPFITHH
ncbi:MAG TPA: amino acid--tRNA ligase-related protein, partial [Nitrococcus sp.]|nr:amino acid--tRNA ligase-related protein [Nitrococcus sp.]